MRKAKKIIVLCFFKTFISEDPVGAFCDAVKKLPIHKSAKLKELRLIKRQGGRNLQHDVFEGIFNQRFVRK